MAIEKFLADSINSIKNQVLNNPKCIIDFINEINKSESEHDSEQLKIQNYTNENTNKKITPSTEKQVEKSDNKIIPQDAAIEQNKNHADYLKIMNTQSRNKRLNIMVIGAALGLILCLGMLTSYKQNLPGEVVGIISTISGIFGACLKDAYSFEFGSSRGSKEKDEKISSAIIEKLKY